jgi:polygalacturonase
MITRRGFVGAAGLLAAGAVLGAQSRQPTIDVKKLGAVGNGKTSDVAFVRMAIRSAAETLSGATIYFPPGEYYLGAADTMELLSLRNAENLRIVGDRATLTCRAFSKCAMFALGSSRNIVFEGLGFRDYGLIRERTLGAYAIAIVQNDGPPTENIEVRDCTFDSVLSAMTAGEGSRVNARGLRFTNITVTRSVYGLNFADCGDDVTARGFRCNDVMRSYFPYGVTNHDIELDTRNNATGFTDVLIKCYDKVTQRLKVKVTCRGKRSGDAIVAFDNQHSKGQGVIRDISVELDVDDADCRLDRVVLARSFDANARYERQTQNRWDNISLDGDVRVCDSTKLIDVLTVSKTPGRMFIGSRLSKHPRLPSNIPGFNVTRA